MGRRSLRKRILICVGLLAAYGVCYFVMAISSVGSPVTHALADLIPIVLAVPLTLLAWWFNRRISYLNALRHFWGKLVPAAQQAIQYTHLTSPSHADFARVQETLSVAIDELRGVFKNVEASGAPKGLYPYENLKEIQEWITRLGYGDQFKPVDARWTRQCVVRLWQEMHLAMLSEFDRDVPEKPVSKYLP